MEGRKAETEAGRKRTKRATEVRSEQVDRRIAARLMAKGWKVTLPNGEPYVPDGREIEAGKPYDWDKY